MKSNGYVGGIYNWIVGDIGYSDVELLKEMGIGLFVIELMGQGVNIVIGDYFCGVVGFWVENGEI